MRELSTWSQLRHKSIAALLGLALFQGQLAMVSAWNKNGNVMDHIKERPNVDRYALVRHFHCRPIVVWPTYIFVQCMQVSSAVAYLHRLDVVSAGVSKNYAASMSLSDYFSRFTET